MRIQLGFSLIFLFCRKAPKTLYFLFIDASANHPTHLTVSRYSHVIRTLTKWRRVRPLLAAKRSPTVLVAIYCTLLTSTLISQLTTLFTRYRQTLATHKSLSSISTAESRFGFEFSFYIFLEIFESFLDQFC